jgi:hypothetical protein
MPKKNIARTIAPMVFDFLDIIIKGIFNLVLNYWFKFINFKNIFKVFYFKFFHLIY